MADPKLPAAEPTVQIAEPRESEQMVFVNRENAKPEEKILRIESENRNRPYFEASYILMVIWIVFANLNVFFAIFTWNSYTRLVAGANYKKHVDDFGAYSWIAGPFTMLCGITSDALGNNIKSRPVRFGKLLGVWFFVIFNLIFGVILGFLQVKIGLLYKLSNKSSHLMKTNFWRSFSSTTSTDLGRSRLLPFFANSCSPKSFTANSSAFSDLFSE